uniref:U3 small nucleolar ribonucleoprotein protein MPP10 n=1 Tax=Culicoides sonorensis TaxID=179676 RepID=A0A336MGH9_CULSO
MLSKTTKKLKKLTSNPEQFLIPQNEKAEKLKETVKQLYDFTKSIEIESQQKRSALNELVIDQMDEEQIWQQMEINNEEFVSDCLALTSNMLSINQFKLDLPYEKVIDDENVNGNGIHDSDDEDSDDQENGLEEAPVKNKKKLKSKSKKKSSIVDDQFFKLSEMEAFLVQEDKKEMQKGKKQRDPDSESEIDLFEDPGDSEDSEAEREENLKYSEYFDPDSQDEYEDDDDEEEEEENDDLNDSRRKVKFNLSKNTETTINSDYDEGSEMGNHDDNENESGEKSTYEKRQEALQKTIKRLEDKALEDKKWQLKGEITAQTRPENALLEEFLEFDAATRPAPIITEQTTMQLEDIIKQRLKDRAFDDVVRKIKPVQSVQEYRKTLVLDSEKSKESLAQIYEKEFLKAAEKLDPDADDKVEEEPKEHKEIRKTLKTLFAKLDALSNYHLTPKPAVPELKIITNTPAIEMEEVAPISMSSGTLLAPEEIKAKPKGDTIMSKDEMTKTDKARKRREKKLKQKLRKKQHDEKMAENEKSGKVSKKNEQKKVLSQVMKNRNVEKMKETKGAKLTTSSTFFSKLQEENVAIGIKKKNKKKSDTNVNGLSAKALKL